jgi:hypothetical protein
MSDLLYASGSFDWIGGSFGTEYVAYVLGRPDDGDQPVLSLRDGTAKIYDLNPVNVLASGAMAFQGGSALLFMAQPFGGFEDFAIFPETSHDPLTSLVVARSIPNSGGVGNPWTRPYAVLVPPKKARFAVPHIKLGSMPASTSQYLDAHQMEVLRTDQSAPSAFESARSIRVHVRPKRLNYAIGSNVVTNLIPGRTYIASAAVNGAREHYTFVPQKTTEVLTFSNASFYEDFSRSPIGTKPDATNTHYDNTIGDVGDDASGGVVATTVADTLFGGRCVNFNNPVVQATTFGFLGKHVVTPADGIFVMERFYQLDVAPGFRTSVLLYKDSLLGGTHIGSLAFGGTGQSGKFVLVNVDTNSTTSTNAVPLGAWFRVRVTLDTIRHTQTAELFLGADIFKAKPTEVITASMGSTALGYIEDGIVTNPNVSINVKMTRPRNMNHPASKIMVEEGSTPGDYFDGDSGPDYLWEQGGTPGSARSYYYPDRTSRHYILVRTLQENVALGMTVEDPVYATFPSPSSTS